MTEEENLPKKKKKNPMKSLYGQKSAMEVFEADLTL